MSYRFSESHPMHPSRLDLTMRLVEGLGILERRNISLLAPEVATDEELALVHDPEYISAVRYAGEHPDEINEERGLGTEDTPAFADIHAASARLAGGSLQAADAVLAERALHVVNFAGGMHHASRGKASGFCVYNDAALAVQRLLDGGTQRVAYIDVDAHHGDGTQSIFWDDPRVLTISLHESGMSLFPGTGFANETGGSEAMGSAVNVALPAGTTDAGWLRAFHAVVPQLVAAFEPEVIVSQHGCDGHGEDDLSNLRLSIDGQRQNALDISDLAQRHCGGRWIATGGGGYNLIQVVPRAWSHLVAIAGGRPVPLRTEVPGSWLAYVKEKYGATGPALMNDGVDLWWRSWEVGYDPADFIDRTIMATRKEVFPVFGLDPWFD
ncbi:MAG: acetoin utilization protein AcuC [Arthrobacter sp.]|uniref:acetoin utilization protein AcuC n=1 Tax=unclassified Arthrobacter TaxID=235627 RepID=UPI0026566490|nr:acetoin utilization protein AcuC [Micrococcaceae bacterium]MDN5812077.1 acetoin utilization protein AcuC [Micrococcaceae bacterium]MDN5823138.1 acetoin utilization protein AcuC [Micrococcaceae bacterium]MDN5878517.1 acetoin utilization protein AcuC [Micrococcaceae bacterium]MDN5885427.1 acetoin utilization protein AcuC [Micrococcaceae bacterium]